MEIDRCWCFTLALLATIDPRLVDFLLALQTPVERPSCRPSVLKQRRDLHIIRIKLGLVCAEDLHAEAAFSAFSARFFVSFSVYLGTQTRYDI